MLLFCCGYENHDQNLLRGKESIWLMLPGHNSSLKVIKARTRASNVELTTMEEFSFLACPMTLSLAYT